MQGSDVLEGWLPDWLPAVSSATVDLDGEPPYSFGLDADAEFAAPDADAYIDTRGRIETTPEGFESTGTLAFQPPEPRAGDGSHWLEIEASGDGHVARGRHRFPAEGVWRSRDTAERALVNAVEELASSVGVDADAEMELYEMTEDHVELRYVAELHDVETGVAETLHRWFGDPAEISETGLEVDRISLKRSSEDGETSYSWDVETRGHLPLSGSLAETAGWSRAVELTELRRTTGFGVEVDWSVHLGDDVSLSVDYGSTNGRRYVEALQASGFDAPRESELRVELDDVDGSRSAEVRYGSGSGSTDEEGSVSNLERWTTMAPAPLLPAVGHYIYR